MKINCWECGREFEKNIETEWEALVYAAVRRMAEYKTPLPAPKKAWKRFYCKDCQPIVRRDQEETKRLYIETKTKITIDRAISTLEKQRLDIYDYQDAIRRVEAYARQYPEKFDSSYEIIAAVMLLKSGVDIKPQHKIGPYRVDFYIPKWKCILEIDGERHKDRLLEDSNRDKKLREELGAEWEVVRIPTGFLDTNAKEIVRAIKELKANKQKIRAANGGIIPASYSKRDKARINKAAKIAHSEL